MKQKRLISLLTLGFILITEIILRLFWSQELSIRNQRDDIFEDDSVLFYTYKPHKKFTVGSTTLQINKEGYIGSEISPKSPDTFRIAIIGACEVAGSVHQPEYYSFVPMLQTHFSDQGDKVEILNCGIDGDQRSLEHYLSVEYKVLSFQPDLIFLQYGLPFYTQYARRVNYRNYKLSYPLNDPEALTFTSHMVDNLYRNEKWIELICHSYIIRGLLNLYRHRVNDDFALYIWLYQDKNLGLGKFRGKQYTMKESVTMIHNLKKRLEEKDISLFLFQFGKDKDILLQAKENRLPLLSLDTPFCDEDYFYKDGHWNDSGCHKIATRFYNLLIKYDLIPSKYLKQSK